MASSPRPNADQSQSAPANSSGCPASATARASFGHPDVGIDRAIAGLGSGIDIIQVFSARSVGFQASGCACRWSHHRKKYLH
jgi:hypothetical protein